MRRLLLVVLFCALPLQAATRVTLLHFSDYHSHAHPFYTEEGQRGGIAYAIGYLKREKRHGALVFSGGDMVNKGAPAWSDRYRCAEWPWLNGVVDAMALGNHEPDYGRLVFDECRKRLRYPLLSANTPGFEPFRIFQRGEVRIGVFAVAGADFENLGVRKNLSYPEAEQPPFEEVVEAARRTVTALRSQKVDAVVMIGHQHAEADERLARAVPGIDLIFGSHSHTKRALGRIDGTSTWFISAHQYLTHLARVELVVEKGRVVGASGELVPVDSRLPRDRAVARRVARMQRDLERDPGYASLFEPVGRLEVPLSVRDVAMTALGAMRSATGADVAMSTFSSFRRPLGDGTLTLEALRASLPYDNEIVTCSMTGAQLERLLEQAAAREATDSGSWISRPESIDPGRTYAVATTDYMAFSAYRDAFDCDRKKTGLRVREELRKALAPK